MKDVRAGHKFAPNAMKAEKGGCDGAKHVCHCMSPLHTLAWGFLGA